MLISAALLAQSPLAILTSALPVGTAGQQYSAALSASGGTAPYTWSASGQFPTGLALLSSGIITGTPASGGSFTLGLTVTDSRGSTASKQLTLTIGGVGSQLAVSTTILPNGLVGQAYNQQLSAVGGSPPYQWTAGPGVPSGLSISSNGLMSGTPAAAGAFSFAVQVVDSAKASATGQIRLTIQTAPLTITTVPPLFVGTVGVAYAQLFSASGGLTPYTWTILTGGTDGLTLTPSTGSLGGIPQTAGTFNFTVQVADSAGATATGSFSLSINAPTLSILVGSTLPAGSVGVAYSQKLPVQALGGTAPYTWSIIASPVPGLSLNSTSLILSGTPTTAGSFSFTLQAADSGGLTATKVLSISITGPGLTITTPRQLPDAVLNVSYSQQVTANGGQPPYRWTASGLPAGLAIDGVSGLISGTPTAAGAFGIAITIVDSTLANYSDRFTMNVNLPQTPTVTLTGLPNTVSPAQQYTVQVTLSSTYAAPIAGQAILTFSPNTGPTDGTIQFSSGGTTANFTIATGSTTNDVPLTFQTGTVSGTLTISLRMQAGGIDITPNPAPSITTQLSSAAPVIDSVQVNRSGSTLNIVVTGFSTAREVTQGTFAFTAAQGQTLQPAASSIVVNFSSLFSAWFLDPNNSSFGTVFILTQPFTVQGDAASVIPVSVTLTNRLGSTTSAISQ